MRCSLPYKITGDPFLCRDYIVVLQYAVMISDNTMDTSIFAGDVTLPRNCVPRYDTLRRSCFVVKYVTLSISFFR